MNQSENLHCLMDESGRPYEKGECPYEFGLVDDLLFLRSAVTHNIELDPDSNLAKLALEISKCGLEITPDTDIKQLAVTVKLLGIA